MVAEASRDESLGAASSSMETSRARQHCARVLTMLLLSLQRCCECLRLRQNSSTRDERTFVAHRHLCLNLLSLQLRRSSAGGRVVRHSVD